MHRNAALAGHVVDAAAAVAGRPAVETAIAMLWDDVVAAALVAPEVAVVAAGVLRCLSEQWEFHAWWFFPQMGHLAVVASLALWRAMHSSIG